MTDKIQNIVERVIKKKAIGIIYNISKKDTAVLQESLADEYKAIIIKGQDAYTSAMLLYRLGTKLKAKNISFCALPSLLEDRAITITCIDNFKPSYNRVLDEAFRYKIPIILLMGSYSAMAEFRKLKAYQRVLTIEQDYKNL